MCFGGNEVEGALFGDYFDWQYRVVEVLEFSGGQYVDVDNKSLILSILFI